jgi:hypothetical protein
LDPFLERKRATVAKLEQATVEIMAVPFPIDAFDERAAEELIEQLDSESRQGQLQPSQADSFARATLQEETIAELLPLYADTSGDLAHMAVDIASAFWVLDREFDRALDARADSLRGQAKTVQIIRRLIDRRRLSIVDSLVQFTVRHAGNHSPGFLLFWDSLTKGIGTLVDTAETVKEIYLDTAVKGAGTRALVRGYVNTVQPSLEQGIRSADPNYLGGDPTWTAEGSLARAEVHARSLPRQAGNINEYAHAVHEDVVKTANLADLFEELADLGTASPWAVPALWAKWLFRIEHTIFDLYAVAVDIESLNCTQHLSESAGSLVFNPDQPAPSCSVVGRDARPSPGMTRQLGRDLQFELPEAVRLRVEGEIADYQEALRDALAALSGGDAQEITEALASLERADADMFTSTEQALSLSYPMEQSSQQAVDAYEQVNKNAVDALRLYLLVGGYLMAPDDERTTAAIEGAAEDVLSDLRIIEEALAEATPPEQPRAMPVIEDIVLPTETPAGDSFDVAVAVRNIGGEDAQQVVVRIIDDEGQPVEARIGRLRAGEIETTTLTAKISGAEEASVVVEVNADGSITDAGVRRLSLEVASPESDTSAPTTDRRSPCVCGAFALSILATALCVGSKRIRIE